MKAVLGLVTLLVLAPCANAQEGAAALETVAAVRCFGLTTNQCEAGLTGQGGCYDPLRAVCQDGKICSVGLSVCKKGPRGGGGCYRAAEYSCDLGAIKSKLVRTGASPQ